MMIDVGAYGAIASPGLATDTFKNVASQANQFASENMGDAYKTATRLSNRIGTISPIAIAQAKKQWNNVARDIQRMGGTLATQGASYAQDQATMMGEYAAQGAQNEMKPYLYAGAAIAGMAVLYLVFRK